MYFSPSPMSLAEQPGFEPMPEITLERGFIPTLELDDWISDSSSGRAVRNDVTIRILDRMGPEGDQPVARY